MERRGEEYWISQLYRIKQRRRGKECEQGKKGRGRVGNISLPYLSKSACASDACVRLIISSAGWKNTIFLPLIVSHSLIALISHCNGPVSACPTSEAEGRREQYEI